MSLLVNRLPSVPTAKCSLRTACIFVHTHTHNTTDDPDKSESGLVYFDLPETEGDDDEEKRQQQQAIQGPPLVMEFWKFIFSLLMLDWLRHNNEHQKKQIKAE